MKRKAACALAVAIGFGVVAPQAVAVPKPEAGKYECFQIGKTFKLRGDETYVYRGQVGIWDYKRRTAKVSFKTGPLDDFYGHHVIDTFTSIDLYKVETKRFKDVCAYHDPDAIPF